MNAASVDAGPTVCLGSALVDLICERPGVPLAAADRFTAHLGGVSANIAVFASRAGAAVALVGAVGADRWGRWATERLRAERVDTTLLLARGGESMQLAFVSLDGAGEPSYRLYPDAAAPLAGLTAASLDDVVRRAAALQITSNTLAGEAERSLTMHARACALERHVPVVLDCNLRLHRWPSERAAVDAIRPCLPGVHLLRANGDEATALTGERDPDRAADALAHAGVRMVVLTLGSDGVIVRSAGGGGFSGRARPVPVRSALGAGDAFTGTLLAAVAGVPAGGVGGDIEATVRDAVPSAIEAGAQACRTWGACD